MKQALLRFSILVALVLFGGCFAFFFQRLTDECLLDHTGTGPVCGAVAELGGRFFIWWYDSGADYAVLISAVSTLMLALGAYWIASGLKKSGMAQ